MARIGDRQVFMYELRTFVLKRDGKCILASTGYPGHACFQKWGGNQPATRDEDYSLEHLTQVHGHLDVRRDDDAHCVALCFRTNTKPPSKEEREWMREKLRRIHPTCSST